MIITQVIRVDISGQQQRKKVLDITFTELNGKKVKKVLHIDDLEKLKLRINLCISEHKNLIIRSNWTSYRFPKDVLPEFKHSIEQAQQSLVNDFISRN